jgi:hypothetical protein
MSSAGDDRHAAAQLSVIVAAIMPTSPIEKPRLPNALANGATAGRK